MNLRPRGFSPWITALTWHRVTDVEGDPFDPGVIDATPREFDEQLATLSRHYSFVDTHDLRKHFAGASLPKNPLLLTFDDGYRACHDEVLPILKKHGAKAVFFISSGYVEHRRTFWWDRLAYLLKTSRRARVELKFPSPLSLDLAGDPDGSMRAAAKVVKRHFALDVERFLGAVAEACDVRWDAQVDREIADRLVMTWDQVRALKSAGHDIQSHGRNHRVLDTLPKDELAEDLLGSRLDLEAQLGEPVRTISFPNGGSLVKVPHMVEAFEAAGYELAFTNECGVIPYFPRPHRYDLRRIPMDPGMTAGEFQTVVALPVLA